MEGKKTYLKIIVMIFMILIFLIPVALIQNLIKERVQTQQEAISEVSSKWGNEQTIAGPILSIPYYEVITDKSKVTRKIIRFAHYLPDSLYVNGTLSPEMRYRGIYQVVVYNSRLGISGIFNSINLEQLKTPMENILLNDAFLALGISDLRGIEEQITLRWNKQMQGFNSGVGTNDVLASGISTHVRLSADSLRNGSRFNLNIELKGSQSLKFVPVGKITQVKISSKWKTPSFDGAFLPDSRQVNAKGFSAYWKVLHLNRNYPQSWTNDSYKINDSAFGVSLLIPIDYYQKAERAVKYSFVLITLTFLLLFFVELLNGVNVHPFQYLLIGLALCIFYTLLLSISEHLSFNVSYCISGVATIGLITLYSRSISGMKQISLLIMGVLIILYGFIFTVLQLEDYALLMGSIGLFVILAIVMYYSKKINWYDIKII
ncbi:cell envelope integrity protein CreD [Parabacteroides sp. FAFU027]|uniref:cell envelope integrity protein CreD n=1 Tax=Parabacteroides sp. FAFU027 TaxID=2922715 RepID=UPI001FAE7E88|nr:cell envelope integrity protein CreD [Parabacteroides sp. FAFU027]